LIYHYDGSLLLNFDLWNISSGIDDAVVTDKTGNSYLGIDFAKPDNSNNPWDLVNFVSFDPFGNLRFKMKIGNEKGFHDIDATPCLLSNYLITGTSAWLPGPFLVKVR